jgi:hypothetical protein
MAAPASDRCMTPRDGASTSIFWRRALLAMLAIGAVGLVAYANQTAERSLETENDYLKRHPLTAKQVAANAHFSACWHYRNASHIVLTEKQRNTLLRAEKCYFDERKDPRYGDATYPWNHDAPQPWIKTKVRGS